MIISIRTAAVCGLLLASTLGAASFNLVSVGDTRNVNLILDNVNVTDTAGSLNITVDGNQLRAVCVDIRTSISIGDVFQANALQPANAIANWQQVSWLVETYMNPAGASFLGTGVATANNWAGLQMAIWDLVTDVATGRGFDVGNLRAQSPLNSDSTIAAQIRNNADSYLLQAANNGHLALGQATVWQHASGPSTKQMLITYGAFYPDAQVPEPGTWAMMIAGGAVLAVAGRKRLRKQ